MTLEYELQGERELRDVRIAIPLGCPPTSQQTELGDVSYDARAKALVWAISGNLGESRMISGDLG